MHGGISSVCCWQLGLGGDAVGGDGCADMMFGVVVGRI